MYLMDFKYEAASIVAGAAGLDVNDIKDYVEVPAKPEMGDYAFPCFRLAKVMRKAPNMIAAEIAEKITDKGVFSKIEPVAAYINFFTDKSAYAAEVMKKDSLRRRKLRLFGRRQRKDNRYRLFVPEYRQALPRWASAFHRYRRSPLQDFRETGI